MENLELPPGGRPALYNRVQFLPPKVHTECLLEVRIHGIIVGRIRQTPSLGYGYYRLPSSAVVPFHEDQQLTSLLARVARNP